MTYSSSIYLGDPKKAPSPILEIGYAWNQLQQKRGGEKSLHVLGVEKGDRQGISIISKLAQQILSFPTKFSHLQENSGVWEVESCGRKVAYVKAGELRARTDQVMRGLAVKMGLDVVAPAVSIVIDNPEFHPEEETVVELFGNQVKVYGTKIEMDKIYHGLDPELFPKIIGSLQPNLEKNPIYTLENSAKLVLFALVIGLRDAKTDGIKGNEQGNPEIIDLGDCMPGISQGFTRKEMVVAPTHLPFLKDNCFLQDPWSRELFQGLRNLVMKTDWKEIEEWLEKQQVKIADLGCEAGKRGVTWADQADVFVEIEPLGSQWKEKRDFPKGQDSPLFTESQIQAFQKRIENLQQYFLQVSVEEEGKQTILKMIEAVDPIYKEQRGELLRRGYSRQNPFDVLGLYSLQQIFQEKQKVQRALFKTPETEEETERKESFQSQEPIANAFDQQQIIQLNNKNGGSNRKKPLPRLGETLPSLQTLWRAE